MRRPTWKRVLLLFSTVILLVLLWQAFVWWGAKARVQSAVSEVRNLQSAAQPTGSAGGIESRASPRLGAGGRSNSGPQSYVVPPLGIPLREIYTDLKNAAASGSSNAACRLGLELMRCEVRRVARQRPPRPAGEVSSTLIERGARDDAICEGFANQDNLEAWEMLFRAALLGHRPSMEVFSRLPPTGLRESLTRPDAVVAYYQFSVPFLEQLAGDGNLKAVEELAHLYAGQSWYQSLGLPGPVDVNYRTAIMYAEIALARNTADSSKAYFRRFIAELASKISPEEWAVASAQAKEISEGLRDIPVPRSATSGTDRAAICQPPPG